MARGRHDGRSSKERSQVRALIVSVTLGLAVAAGVSPLAASAQQPAKPEAAASDFAFAKLLGRWVRPDGGYVISIKSVGADGTLDASYANPAPLPFARAEASRDGATIKLFFELRAGGYNGSTYTLTYDPAADSLAGVYYQAVARQKFDVQFTRARP